MDSYTEKTDIWACGCITFELLGRQIAFNTPDTREMTRMIRAGKLPKNKAYEATSNMAQTLVNNMMRMNPNERFIRNNAEMIYGSITKTGIRTR